MKIYDPYSKYHGKIDLAKIVPKLIPLSRMEHKSGSARLTARHVRKSRLRHFNLFTNQLEERIVPLPSFKSILELSCRAPYCPIPFVLDTMMGVCSYNCIYCFTALTLSSLMTSFFDSDKPLAPRYANKTYTKKYLNEVLTARGVEPYERKGEAQACGSTTDMMSLKKASAQRVPLRFGTRSENFLPKEREIGVALVALKVIKDHEYPLIINTKSDLIIEEPYFSAITEMGGNVAIQVSINHNNDKIAKKLEPGAPSSTKRWEVLKILNEVGINSMPRMEPAMAFINNDDEHLNSYFTKAKDSGCKKFMGDLYHHTVKAEQVMRMFYREGFDFDRMWEATTEYQILGSYVWEKTMFYAKKYGLKAGTFNFHSLPWNDDPVCCMVGEQFGSWNKYSMVHFLKNEVIERGRASFSELDDKYYGYELHPGYRTRIKKVWNLKLRSAWNPDWCEGMIPIGRDKKNNLIWRFEPSFMGEGYNNLIKMFGENKND